MGTIGMLLKDFWMGTSHWFRTRKSVGEPDDHPELDDEGLLCSEFEFDPVAQAGLESDVCDAIVHAKTAPDKRDPVEKLKDGFDQLVRQLQGINEHLAQQLAQNKALMAQFEHLPGVFERLPELIENQRRTGDDLSAILAISQTKESQFAAMVERIPEETAKQNQVLETIERQLSNAVDVDKKMTQGFEQFGSTVDRLQSTAEHQAGSLDQLTRTFAASDEYFRMVMARQNKRLAWLLVSLVSVGLLTVAGVTGMFFL